jgi:hypothetical protein
MAVYYETRYIGHLWEDLGAAAVMHEAGLRGFKA